MANTYHKIYLHIVFAVKARANLLPVLYLNDIHAYMGGVLRRMGHIPLCIGGTEDHVHILISYNMNQLIPDLVREVKTSTSRFIAAQRFVRCKFEWQAGYACLSCSQSHVEAVEKYISNQFEHHRHTSLDDEIVRIMDKYDIPYDLRYILKTPE